MTELRVSRSAEAAPSETSDFFNEVKNGRDENTRVPGGYGSYPKIYVVAFGDEVFYGFGTSLPEDREPWIIGFRPVTRDSVINAHTLEEVEGLKADFVNAVIADERDELTVQAVAAILNEIAAEL